MTKKAALLVATGLAIAAIGCAAGDDETKMSQWAAPSHGGAPPPPPPSGESDDGDEDEDEDDGDDDGPPLPPPPPGADDGGSADDGSDDGGAPPPGSDDGSDTGPRPGPDLGPSCMSFCSKLEQCGFLEPGETAQDCFVGCTEPWDMGACDAAWGVSAACLGALSCQQLAEDEFACAAELDAEEQACAGLG